MSQLDEMEYMISALVNGVDHWSDAELVSFAKETRRRQLSEINYIALVYEYTAVFGKPPDFARKRLEPFSLPPDDRL